MDYKNLKLEKMNQSSPNFETPGGENSFCKIENITPKRETLMGLSDVKGASVIKPLITKDDFIKITSQIEIKDKKESMEKKDEPITSSFDNQSRDTNKVVKLDLSQKQKSSRGPRRKREETQSKQLKETDPKNKKQFIIDQIDEMIMAEKIKEDGRSKRL